MPLPAWNTPASKAHRSAFPDQASGRSFSSCAQIHLPVLRSGNASHSSSFPNAVGNTLTAVSMTKLLRITCAWSPIVVGYPAFSSALLVIRCSPNQEISISSLELLQHRPLSSSPWVCLSQTSAIAFFLTCSLDSNYFSLLDLHFRLLANMLCVRSLRPSPVLMSHEEGSQASAYAGTQGSDLLWCKQI